MSTVMNASRDLLGGMPMVPLVFSCDHGSSTCCVIPGTDDRRNRIAVELARARHPLRTGCACPPRVVRIQAPRDAAGGAVPAS